jgi:hypothetical protein
MKHSIKYFVAVVVVFLISGFIGSNDGYKTKNNSGGIAIPDVMGYIKQAEWDGEKYISKTVLQDSFQIFPGFPVTFTGQSFEGGVYCNMDSDPYPEIVYNIGYNVCAIKKDGSNVAGWPKTVASYALEGAPAVGDIDGDGQDEIIVTNHGLTSGGYIYAFKKDGSTVPGFPINHGYSSRTPVLADVNGDGKMEIIVNKRTYPTGQVYIYKGDGTVLAGWPKSMNSVPASSSAAGDINGDGIIEIVSESYNALYCWSATGDSLAGFPFTYSQGDNASYSSPVLADLNNDNKKEIIFGTHLLGGGGFVYALRYDGTVLSGWPKSMSQWVYAPPAVGYIDGDNVLDIAVGDQVMSGTPIDEVCAWNANGATLTGFPITNLNAINAQILLADIDGDNNTELIFDDNTTTSANRGQYLAYKNNGVPCGGKWPLALNGTTFFSTPCLYDADRNGIMDMSGTGAIGSGSSAVDYVYIWNLASAYNASKIYLPMWQYNPRHNGVYGDIVTTGITEPSTEIVQEYQLEQNYPNPFNPSTVISFSIPKSSFVKIEIYNISGRKAGEVFSGNKTAGKYSIEFNAQNYQLASGVYFYTLQAENIFITKKMIYIK